MEPLLPTAGLAQQLAKKQPGGGDLQDVFFAGMVHDLGRLIFLDNRPEEYAAACQEAIAQKTSWKPWKRSSLA